MKNLILETVLLLFVLMAVGCSSTPPSDKSMEEKFRTHEAGFKKLASMFKEDANLDSVDETAAYLPGDGPGNRPKAELSTQRLDEYRRLLKQTGVKNIFRNKDGSVHFGAWSGWYGIDPTSSQGKDYMYAEKPPSLLVDSLDQTDKLGYKKIADNWYLVYDIAD